MGTARIAFEPAPGFRSGLFAAGWITTAEREGLGVPATAVVMDGVGAYVLAVSSEGILERRDVSPLLLWEGWIEVEGAIEPGDEVVVRAAAFFADGDVIEPVTADDTGGAARPGDKDETP